MKDQLRLQIEDALLKDIDPLKFQKCASELLGEVHPTLVLITGGHDFGRDGAIASTTGDSFLLTCTTSKRVLSNFRKSISSFIESGGPVGRAIIATSRKITPTQRRNLEQEARQLGFTLVQVYDHSWFARELYRNHSWRRELLGISGRPLALSSFPKTRRMHLNMPLVAREGELRELRTSKGDLVIYGEPGVGKTFLLQGLVEDGWGLFLVDSNKEALADAIRELAPPRVIVDDAHFTPGVIDELRQLRASIDATFDIVATSWPDWTPDIGTSLPNANSVTVARLTQNQILDVIKGCGVAGPLELQRNLVHQARGRPGVAAALSFACLFGGLDAVWRGELLLKDVFGSFGVNRNEQAQAMLAILALAGDGGLDIVQCAQCLGGSTATVLEAARELASGGLLEPRRHAPTNVLVVQPEVLRFAIVVEYFFKGRAALPLTSILAMLPDSAEPAIPLIAAAHRGCQVDRGLLLGLLKAQPTARGVRGFAALGETETEIALEQFPELRIEVAREALTVAPQLALTTLFELSVGDERERHSHPDHPMRIIEDYAHSLSDSMIHRSNVMAASKSWVQGGGDADAALEAMALAVDPQVKGSWSDAGAGNTITLSQGLLPLSDIIKLEAIWDDLISIAQTLTFRRFQPVLASWENWIWPSRLLFGGNSVPDATYKHCRNAAREIAKELAAAFSERPGIIARLKQTYIRANLRNNLVLPEDFEILFPSREYPSGEFSAEMHQELERQHHARARKLARDLAEQDPARVIERILFIEREADVAGLSRWPHTTPTVCQEIAIAAANPGEWMLALEGTASIEFYWHFRPCCDAILQRLLPGWKDLTRRLLNTEGLSKIMALACLKADVPDDFLEVAVSRCDSNLWNVLRFESRRFTRKARLLLLRHDNPDVRGAVLQGYAMDGISALDEEEQNAILELLVTMPADDFWIPTLLGRYPHHLKRWIFNWVDRSCGKSPSGEHPSQELLKQVAKLSLADRCEVLNKFPAGIYGFIAGDVVNALAGDDIETTEIIFSRPELKEHRGGTIGDQMDEAWVKRAEIALNHGATPEQVMMEAALPSNIMTSWSGDESARWATFIARSRSLMQGSTNTHQILGAAGLKVYAANQERAMQRENDEAVYGRDL